VLRSRRVQAASGRNPSEPRDRLLLGEIGAAQGLKGEVRIRSYTQDPAAIARYDALEDEQGRHIEIESLRVAPKALIARIKGVATREAAEALNRTKLYIERALLPERQEEEWYHAELIGLTAMGSQGEAIGTVVAIHNFGAGDLIEVKPAKGGATVLVPFTRDAVPEVDVEGGRLTLVPPESLFD
jgi:16S rRNA processing protein RimM